MCKVIEEMRKEEREEGMKAAALRMLDAGKYVLDEIASISGLPLNEVEKLQAERSA